MKNGNLSRRDFLRATAIATGAMAAAACGAPEPAAPEAVSEGAVTTGSDCEQDWVSGWPPAPIKYDPVVEVSVPFNAWPTFAPGYDATNNPYYNWYLEEMGIKFNIHWMADGELRQQKLQADIAAGTMPDMINLQDPLFNQLIDEGALKEIKDIWEATASPLSLEVHRYPEGKNWIHCFRNNRQELYGLDLGITDKVFCTISWIRNDWLEQLDMPMPDSVEGWDKTLHAFNEEGLCAYGITAQKSLFSWAHDFTKIFGAYRVMPGLWRDYGDGKLVYDSLTDTNKDVLELLNGWYSDGLMDPDFHTLDWASGLNTAADGNAGIVTMPMWGTSRIVEIEKKVQGEFKTMPLPTGPTGEMGRRWTSPVFHAWVFRHDLEDIKVEALIQQLNHQRELHVNGPTKHNAYGPLDDMGNDGLFQEGYDWEWDENCEISLLEYQTGSSFRDVGFHHATYPGYQRHADLNRQRLRKMDPSELSKVEKYFIRDPGLARQEVAYAQLFEEAEYEIENEFLGVNTPRMNELLPNLQKLEDEFYLSIVLGLKPLDAFEEYVSEWHEHGGDEVAEDVNAWYESYNQS